MIRVNLLSPERKEISGVAAEAAPIAEEEKEKKISVGAGVGAAVITVGIIGFLYVTQAQSLEKKKNTLNEKRAKKVQLKDVENTLKELEQAKNDLTKKVTLIGQLKSRQQSTVKMMDELSNALPEWVWLTGLSFSGNQLGLNGKALNNNLIANFINNLKATNSFSNIEFRNSTRRKQAGFEDIFTFRITCTFNEQPSGKKAG